MAARLEAGGNFHGCIYQLEVGAGNIGPLQDGALDREGCCALTGAAISTSMINAIVVIVLNIVSSLE